MKMFRKIRGKKGFTLVEMLLVIAILMILMAFAVPGFSAYTKRIKLMELDDSARSIFMAAQNRLVTLKSAGADSFEFEGSKEIKDTDVPEEYMPRDEDGRVIEFTDTDGHDKILLRYITSDNIRSLGDGSSILNLSSGSIDGQLAINDFVIEYDARTGFVYGVFYAEEEGALDLDNFSPKDAERDFEKRLNAGGNIGYYGGGEVEPYFPEDKTPEIAAGGSSSKEKLAQEVVNDTGERQYFYLTITGYDYRAYKDKTFQKKDEYKHTIAIIPKESKCYLDPYTSCIICLDSIAPGKSADTTGEASDGYGWTLPASKKTSEGYNLTDYVMERDFRGWVFENCFKKKNENDPAWNNGTNPRLEELYEVSGDGWFVHYDSDITFETKYSWDRNNYKGKVNDDFQKTDYPDTVHYIIEPGTDIDIEYGFYDPANYTVSGEPVLSTDVNSYFSKFYKNEEGKNIVEITSGRHLQNLALYTLDQLVDEAYIMETIDFSIDHTGKEDCYDYWNSAETNKGTERAQNLYDFLPIYNQFVQSSKGVTIRKDPNTAEDIQIRYIRIDSTTSNDGKDYTIDTFLDDNYKYIGFITSIKNREIYDLTFYCPVVKSKGQYTGVVFGLVDSGSKFGNITVINPIVEVVDDGESDKELYVGGIGGQWNHDQTPSGNKVYVEEVYDYFDNYHSYEERKTTPENILWEDGPEKDPYARFFVKCNDPDGYAGGLLGSAEAPVMGASASVHVESKGYAGGLVGKLNSSVNNSYVAGHTHNGTFIGRREIGGEDYVLQNIYGEKAAGGVAGYVVYNGAVDEKNNPVGHGLVSTYTTCSVASESPENADTFAGDGPYSTSNNSYALGYVISDGKIAIKKIDDTSATGDDLLDRMIHGHRAAAGVLASNAKSPGSTIQNTSYDEFIKDSYKNYPYKGYDGNQTEHLGDWPCGAPIVGMFYWEKLDDGKVNYHAIYYNGEAGKTNEEIVKEHPELSDYYALNTLDSDAETVVTDFGYGYFYTDAAGVGGSLMDGVGENCDAEIISEIIKPLTQSVGTAVNVVCKKTSGTNTVHGARVLPFTCGESTVKFCYSPDYYGLEYVAESENLGKDGTPYHVRSAKQFDNIRNALSGVFAVDKNVTLGTAEAGFKPIGSLSGYFTGKVDGKIPGTENKCKITIKNIDFTEQVGIGLFGVTRGATLTNLDVKVATDENVYIYVSNKAVTAGVGTITGIAIGGEISGCTAENYFMGIGGNNQDVAAGGIVGYSSAKINSCSFNGGIRFSEEALAEKGRLYAIGGIAGSASGNITDCYTNLCSSFTESNEENSKEDGSFVFAGGVVGNNVDYIGQTVLNVDKCVSESCLVRGTSTTKKFQKNVGWSKTEEEEVRTVNVFKNALIHPIAPDELTITSDKSLFYNDGNYTDTRTWWERFIDWIKWLFGDSQNNSVKEINLKTGTGVDKDQNLTVTITNCKFSQGWADYDSQIIGNSFKGIDRDTWLLEAERKEQPAGVVSDVGTSLNDVYTVPPVSTIPYATYTKKAPTVGIYSLYEKSSNTGSEIVAKAFTTSEANRTLDLSGDVSSGDCDKLGRYGIITDLGRIDDPDLIITVDGNRINLPGQVYTVESVNPALEENAKQYYDFSAYIIDATEPHDKVTITYKMSETLTVTLLEVKIPDFKRAPYFGVYSEKKDGYNKVFSGEYISSYEPSAKTETVTTEKTETISAGVMVEHSVAAPRTLDELTVTVNIVDEENKPISDTSLAIYDGKTLSASDFAPAQTGYSYTAYGKKFDYYELKPEIFNAIPEGATVTLTAKPTRFDGPELKTTFTKPIKRPVLGVFAEYKVWSSEKEERYKMPVAAAKVVEGENKVEVFDDLEQYIQTDKEFVGFGVMVQNGFDLDKLTVTLKYDSDRVETIKIDNSYSDSNEASLARKDQWNTTKKYSNQPCNAYLIPNKLLENVKGIELSYQCTAKVAQTVSADFKKELKSETIGHTHSAPENAWHSDETSHWYECDDENCPDGKGTKFDIANHEFGEWVVTVEPEEHKTGLKVCVCEICGREKTEEIPEHKHEVGDTWETDENNHWKVCKDENCPLGKGYRVAEEPHSWVIASNGNTTEKHAVQCTVCKMNSQLPHTWDEGKKSDDGKYMIYACTFEGCNATKEELIPGNIDSGAKYGGVGAFILVCDWSDVIMEHQWVYAKMIDGTIVGDRPHKRIKTGVLIADDVAYNAIECYNVVDPSNPVKLTLEELTRSPEKIQNAELFEGYKLYTFEEITNMYHYSIEIRYNGETVQTVNPSDF